MHTGRVMILLCLLSILVLGRTGISLWSNETPEHDVISVAQAASPSNTGSVKNSIDTHLIPEAEALPYTPEAEVISQAERETLLSLRKIRDKLNARKKALDEREQAAKSAEETLSERLSDLETLEARIKDMLSQEQSINTKKIKRLTAVYEGMKADRAAPVVARMDLPTVVRMFSRMDEKKVGKILSFLPPDQAVKISQALTDRISNVK